MSQVYYQVTQLLLYGGHFNVQYTGTQKAFCDGVIKGYYLFATDVTLIAYCLDPRFVDCRLWIDNDSVWRFLEKMKERTEDTAEHSLFVKEYYKFKMKEAPYKDEFYKRNGNRWRCIFSPETKWEKAKDFWNILDMKYKDETEKEYAGVKLLCRKAKDFFKMPTGIEAVEQANSWIKLIQRAQRASLSPEMIACLVYIVANEHMLKRFNLRM